MWKPYRLWLAPKGQAALQLCNKFEKNSTDVRAFPWVQIWVESSAVRLSTQIFRLLWQQKTNKVNCVLTLTCATALPGGISLDAHRRPCILFSLIEYLHWQNRVSRIHVIRTDAVFTKVYGVACPEKTPVLEHNVRLLASDAMHI
jgi:hypothetical protein